MEPEIQDWNTTELPDAWPDKLVFRRFSDLYLLFKKFKGKSIEKVRIPAELSVNIDLPKYLLQEFHNLPNGNYSKKISRGYITGFDRSMLGKMTRVRKKLAHDLRHCHSALDIGCAGGHSTAALRDAGIKDVWGLDPSPYLLKHAAQKYPELKFIQGLAEKNQFGPQRFDGICASFVFHEIPPKYSRLALNECHRILKKNGLVTICEPAPEQLYATYSTMLRKYGLSGVYFKFLANRVFEPFVDAWHKVNYAQWASDSGFELIEDTIKMPVRFLVLKKS